MIKRYEDFEIDITQQGGQLYADLKAAPGDRNLARPIPITLPDDHVAWTEAYQGRKDRTELAELGHRLFESLITGKLADNWNACRGEVHQQPDTGLRLRFSTQADVLTQVPLELLCIRTEPTSEFLALHTLTPVVRSPRSGKPVEKRPITPPLRMLVIIANPKLQEPIDPVAEQASLEEALADIIRTGNLKIDYLGPPGCHRADYTTLHHTLARADPPYNIVHFIGHGALDDDTKEEGLLLLVDSQTGLRRDIYASDLACLLAPNGVRVAVLQACDSARAGRHSTFMGLAQRLIAEGLPAAMAMQYRVDQDIATRFCGQFYHFWLAEGGLPIERALTEARQDVHHRFRDRATAWWTPTLFIRVPSSEVLRVDIGEQSFRTTLYLDLGEALLLSGQIDEAIAKLREAYEKVPDRVSSILTRALVAQAKVREDNGDVDGALVSYEQALKVSPDDQTAQMGKASLLAQYSEMEKEQDRSQPSETASKDWQPGHKLGDGEYEIVEELATTECYIVYRAKELQFNSTVVIKRLKSEKQINERDYQRFKREVAVLKHFLRHIEQHGAVVLRFFGSGKTEAGDRYFVTEFADKGSLKDYLEGRPHNRLSSSEALKIAKAICQGIDAIHGLGIVHRDIKPGNIFLFSGSSGGVRATLADFSIARIPKKWSIENVTIPGMFMGTPRYAAPEQISGSTGPQSDLYSWGLVFFEMLTGEPFLGESPFEVLLSEDEPSLHFFSEKGIPLSFAEILQKTLRKDRKHRYKSAGEILKALDSIQSPTVKDIEQRLRIGEECIEASKWREAGTELERGLELCQWYGEPDKLSGRLGELAHRLEAGYLCVQGTIEKSERQWQAAVDAFEALLRLYPTYPCIDVAAELREAYAGRQDDVAKRKLYDQGKELEKTDPEHAYYKFYELYEQDPNYRDVAERCAATAFQCSKRLSGEGQKVEWLEKVIDIDPSYREGHAQQLLYGTLHDWAVKLLGESRSAAIAQLERIFPDYDKWSEVYQILVDNYYQLLRDSNYSSTKQRNLNAEAEASYRLGIEQWVEGDLQSAVAQFTRISPETKEYKSAQSALAQLCVTLGRQEHEKKQWQGAAKWWDKALAISPNEAYQALVYSYYQLLRDGDDLYAEWSNPEAVAQASYRFGIEQWGEGELQNAVEQLAKIAPEAKEYKGAQSALVQLYVTLGRQEHERKKWQSAAEWWKKARAISPNEVYQALVDSYYQLLRDGNYSSTEWSNLDAEAEARYRLGTERWSKENLEGAVEQLEGIPKETHEFPSAQFALVQIYERLAQRYDELGRQEKDRQNAFEWFEKAKKIRAKAKAAKAILRAHEIGGEPETESFHKLWGVLRQKRKMDT